MTDTTRLLQLRDRFRQLPAVRDRAIRIEPGTKDDYRTLARFHYKGRLPGVITAVYRAVHDEPTVVGRYLGRTSERQVIGVLLRSLPHLGCVLRDHATRGRYRGLGGRAAAQMINREVRTISRVVIDPRWRGVGLAVQLVKHALAQPETIFTEALAAMGRVHPFFEKAGMARYDRPPRPEHARLADALEHAGLPPSLLASTVLTHDRLAQLPGATQQWIELELRRWHRAAFRTPCRHLAALSLDELLRGARDQLFVHPVYYFCDHRPPPPPPDWREPTHMPMIPLDKLAAHPGNANRMHPDIFTKLVAHVAATGDYPPLIVRRIHGEAEQYQILDGHHRAKALAQLGRTEAKCEVWDADDDHATLLLLTLNRLQGSDDPVKRAQLLAHLAANEDLKALEAKLPEDRAKIAKLLALCEPPPEAAPPRQLDEMPQAVTFFLTAPQRDRLLSTLRRVNADRSAALVTVLELDGACA